MWAASPLGTCWRTRATCPELAPACDAACLPKTLAFDTGGRVLRDKERVSRIFRNRPVSGRPVLYKLRQLQAQQLSRQPTLRVNSTLGYGKSARE